MFLVSVLLLSLKFISSFFLFQMGLGDIHSTCISLPFNCCFSKDGKLETYLVPFTVKLSSGSILLHHEVLSFTLYFCLLEIWMTKIPLRIFLSSYFNCFSATLFSSVCPWRLCLPVPGAAGQYFFGFICFVEWYAILAVIFTHWVLNSPFRDDWFLLGSSCAH